MVNDKKETPRAGSEPRPSRFSVGAITPQPGELDADPSLGHAPSVSHLTMSLWKMNGTFPPGALTDVQ